jgi:hypothetical protein
MDGNAALQIRERKGRLSVPAIRRANQIEERIILRDRHHGSVTEGPTYRRKIAGKHPNLTNKRA